MPTYNSVISRSNASALMPEEYLAPLIAQVQQQTPFLSLGTRLPNMSNSQTRLPVLASLPVGYFVTGDTGLKQTSSVSWENKYIDAEEVAVIIPISEAVLEDAAYDIWGQIMPLVAGAFAKTIGAAIAVGTNAPSNWPDDLLTQITSASHLLDVSSGFSSDYYDAYLGADGAFSLVEQDGYMVNGVVALPALKGILRGIKDTQDRPIFSQSMQNGGEYVLDGAPISFDMSNSWAASSALSFQGDFKQLVWAVRQEMRVKLLTEASIYDGAGNVIYALAQQDMVALRCTMRLGWQVPNVINQTNETEATRFPFSAVKA